MLILSGSYGGVSKSDINLCFTVSFRVGWFELDILPFLLLLHYITIILIEISSKISTFQ